ncbi:TonB-dependent receptor [Spongiibacter taiwanensis]|uniref:TonB-dependent receptor domain-containing protein n=1 Tax=Spongiibacter taiwanensis TaxID=1748242 RepID=UPI002035DCA9|nr:TonB-dependent receptor [Spongiibacter taiwanensis]USA42797.1 TonB-dependent receptor [Spongiibacter taiwanensis]
MSFFVARKVVPAVKMGLLLSPLVASGLALAEHDKKAEKDVEEVVVTAAGYQQRIIDAPASVSVVTNEELRKAAYSTIVDAMWDIPGVYLTGGSNMQDISIRGMDDSYTLYLVDGRPISAGRSVNTNGADGGKQIGMPPLSMIERVEVIRGPMSSLYGSEAMGGVVNVITRTTPEDWGGSVAYDYTYSLNDISNDRYNTDFYLGGPLIADKLGLELNGSFQHIQESDFAGGGDSAASNPDQDIKRLGGKLNWRLDEANKFALAVDQSTLDFTHTPGKSIPDTDSESSYEYEKELRTLTHDGNYGKLSVSTYLQQDLSERVQTEDKKEEIIILNTMATYAGDRHIYTFGGRYKTEELVDETNGLLDANVEGATAVVDRWIGAVFAEAEWRFIKDVGLTTGLRYDDDELFGGHFSPRVYVNWQAEENLTIKSGISTGYAQPSLSGATEGFGRGTGGGGSPNQSPDGNSISRALIVGNSDLKPETSVNYEIGAYYRNKPARVTASAMVFHTDFKDKIAEDRYCTSDGVDRDDWQNYTCDFGGNTYYFLSTRKNIDEAEMEGVEMTFSYGFSDNLRVKGNLTYTESEQKTGEFAGSPLNKIPRKMGNISLDWDPTSKLNLWTRLNYRGETSDYLGRTSISDGSPGYSFVDLGVSCYLNEALRVMAGVYNVGNKEITNDTYGVVLDGRRLTVSMTLEF